MVWHSRPQEASTVAPGPPCSICPRAPSLQPWQYARPAPDTPSAFPPLSLSLCWSRDSVCPLSPPLPGGGLSWPGGQSEELLPLGPPSPGMVLLGLSSRCFVTVSTAAFPIRVWASGLVFVFDSFLCVQSPARSLVQSKPSLLSLEVACYCTY